MWDGFLFFILTYLEKTRTRSKSWSKGMLFSVWMIGHGAGRFWQEFYRDDFRGPIFIFSLSGWVSLCLIIFGALAFLRFQKSNV
jgi:prolipoprotein diacylglyceryltransferase